MIVEKDKYTFIFKSQFRNLPEIRFQSRLNSRFMEFLPYTRPHFL